MHHLLAAESQITLGSRLSPCTFGTTDYWLFIPSSSQIQTVSQTLAEKLTLGHEVIVAVSPDWCRNSPEHSCQIRPVVQITTDEPDHACPSASP